MAKLLWTPFHHLPRLIATQPLLGTQLPRLLTTYRSTPFSMQDGMSEWKGDGGLLFALQDDDLLGMLRLDKRRTYWILSSFVVNPMFRGHGVGSSMVNAVLGSKEPVWLQVKQDNPAQDMYRRYGFNDRCVSNGRILMRT